MYLRFEQSQFKVCLLKNKKHDSADLGPERKRIKEVYTMYHELFKESRKFGNWSSLSFKRLHGHLESKCILCLGWLSPSRYRTAGTSMGNNWAARPSSSNAMALSGEKKVMYICANIIPAPNSQCLLCQHFFPQLYKILKCYWYIYFSFLKGHKILYWLK